MSFDVVATEISTKRLVDIENESNIHKSLYGLQNIHKPFEKTHCGLDGLQSHCSRFFVSFSDGRRGLGMTHFPGCQGARATVRPTGGKQRGLQ